MLQSPSEERQDVTDQQNTCYDAMTDFPWRIAQMLRSNRRYVDVLWTPPPALKMHHSAHRHFDLCPEANDSGWCNQTEDRTMVHSQMSIGHMVSR